MREISAREEKIARVLALGIVLLALGLLPLIGRSFINLKLSSGDVSPWMPVGTPERVIYDRFSEVFQTHDSLLISWEGATWDDDRLAKAADQILEFDRERAEDLGRPRLIAKVMTLPDLISSFGDEARQTAGFEDEVKEGVSGYLVGKDGQTGVLVLESTEEGLRNRLDAYELARDAVESVVAPEIGEARFTGPCYMGISANEETSKTLRLVTPLTAGISLLVAFFFLRSWVLGLLAFGVSGLASALVITVIQLSGRALGEMLAIVPSLAQLLAMSNVIHLINYYMESVLHQGDRRWAWRYAIRSGWGPTVAASLTTAIGFGALTVSNLPVVKDFALFGMIGVGCSMVIVLLVAPAVLILVRPAVKPPWSFQESLVEGMIRLSSRRKILVSITLLGLFFAAMSGLRGLKSDVVMESFFAEGSAFHRDLVWFQDRFGPLQATDIMVTFNGKEDRPDLGEQFDYIEAFTDRLRDADALYSVFSPAFFRTGISPELRKEEAVLEVVLAHAQDEGWAWADEDGDHWRIALRHPSEPEPGDSAVARTIEGITQTLELSAGKVFGSPRVELTGVYWLFGNSQSDLLRQLLRTFFLAFLIITPVVMIFLRSIKLGGIAILGNLFPLVVFFGLLAWAGQRIDIATMMIAAVAFGIAVDDTVHFLTWLDRGLRLEHTVTRGVAFAYKNCAGAILQTTLIISLGMMAFLLSDFKPSVRFAIFSAIVLVMAVIGDLILLPALIQGPFQRLFRRFRGDPYFLD